MDWQVQRAWMGRVKQSSPRLRTPKGRFYLTQNSKLEIGGASGKWSETSKKPVYLSKFYERKFIKVYAYNIEMQLSNGMLNHHRIRIFGDQRQISSKAKAWD